MTIQIFNQKLTIQHFEYEAYNTGVCWFGCDKGLCWIKWKGGHGVGCASHDPTPLPSFHENHFSRHPFRSHSCDGGGLGVQDVLGVCAECAE